MNNNKSLEKLGEIIYNFRKAKSLSQIAVGQQSETSQMTVQRLESGRGNGTSLDSLMSIAKTLEISLSDVFHELEKNDGNAETQAKKSSWEQLIEKLNSLPPESKKWISELIEKALEHPHYDLKI
jgi:transcriptional regulator with XRE-family HTH domain